MYFSMYYDVKSFYIIGLAQVKENRALTNVEQHQVRMKDPIPDNIGCQYASKVIFFLILF